MGEGTDVGVAVADVGVVVADVGVIVTKSLIVAHHLLLVSSVVLWGWRRIVGAEVQGMNELGALTGHKDVDDVLYWFLARVRELLRADFVGMYLYGSLALGDFDPAHSDIDFIVVTEAELTPAMIAVVGDMHVQFDQSGSVWHGRIEAAYAAREALCTFPATEQAYPQVEKGRALFVEPLEIGWIFQCFTLRKRGVVLAGPTPKTLIPPLVPDDLRRAAAPIALMWQRQSRTDSTWLEWLRERPNQAFVVLTLCRLLYTLHLADVASKPAAARWVQQSIGEPWSTLIDGALAGQHAPGLIDAWEEQQTLALIDDTVERFHECLAYPM